MVSIRPRTEADIDACISALSVLYKTEDYPKGANRDLHDFLTNEKNEQCWIAEDTQGKIVAHVSTSTIGHDPGLDLWRQLHPDDAKTVSLLSRLFVLPEARGRKDGGSVAEMLMNAAIDWNFKQGYRLLLVVMTNSEAAIRLYERTGWVKFGETKHVLQDGSKSEGIAFRWPLPGDEGS